jgi:CheY-like chemotaxis protein
VVDEAEARLRGIERDLHDGAQVRLAALAMTLGEIKENLERNADPQRTIGLAGAAHRNAKETLAELRDLAKGIHPAVLDRGLAEALAVLAEASAVPVGLSVGISGRPSPAIEAIAYFCAAELLANVTKHSGASRALISVTDAEDAAIMRDGLTQTLAHRGHDVVAAVGDAEALRQAVASHRPDVAVIDVRMPPTHTDEGLRAALAIRREHPGVGVLVFSQYIEAKAATDLLAGSPAGPAGVGYLLKDRVADVSDFSGLRVSVQFLDLGTRTEVRVHETNVPESFLAPEAQAGFLTSLDRFGTYLAFLSSSA